MTMVTRRPSTLVAKLAVLGLATLLLKSVLLPTFVSSRGGGAVAPATRRTQMRVSIFDGFELPDFDWAPKEDAEEVLAARTGDNVNGRLVECDQPLGVEFREDDKGDIFVDAVDPNSDAFTRGVRPGAQLVMISATFGEEMWPTRNCGLTQFRTVLASRFGPTITLALENEERSFLDNFFGSGEKKEKKLSAEEEARKVKSLTSSFEEEEAKLKGKKMWNPFF